MLLQSVAFSGVADIVFVLLKSVVPAVRLSFLLSFCNTRLWSFTCPSTVKKLYPLSLWHSHFNEDNPTSFEACARRSQSQTVEE